MLVLAAMIGLENNFGYFSWQWTGGFVVVLLLTTLLSWLTVRVRLATDDLKDPPSIALPKFETRDGVPPLNPHFRGSSGPPPDRDT